MSIKPGMRIGPYDVTAPLGEGGMGVVFRARDARLQRDVALKLLPDHFANDADRLTRFQREAQVLAALNHPNIAQIYGLEQSGASSCIVMELVEGETLAERLKRGPLSIDDTIQIAKQIAEALEAAHERGIVHRDLKPANIKLAPDGKVKVLDFGLAKALNDDDVDRGLSHSPTKVSGSMAGAVIGTAAYRSPEQARGKTIDARTDIWSFGCVTYELLTERQEFEGETATDIIAKILEGRPQWDRLPAETPVPIRLLLEAALNKDPKQRLLHIGGSRVFLNRTSASTELLPATVARRADAWRPGLMAALAVALLGALVPASLYFFRAPSEATEMRFEITAPGFFRTVGAAASTLAISPNGRLIAYIAKSEGNRAIWIRPIGILTAHVLAGTENADDLFWSPDSRYVGFRADRTLKKIDISGGPPTVLGPAQTLAGSGGAWNRNGIILFSGGEPGTPGIVRIPSGGGNITRLTTPQPGKEFGHYRPQFLPDGNHFVYHTFELGPPPTVTSYLTSLDSKEPARQLTRMEANPGEARPAQFVEPGYWMFIRNGILMAQAFDLKRLELSGEPVAVAEGVGSFAASDNGIVTYAQSVNAQQQPIAQPLQGFNRKGESLGKVGSPGDLGGLKLSADGRHVAVHVVTAGVTDVWVIDLDRGVPNRLTFDPSLDGWPIWEPDGNRIVFATSRGGGVLPNKLFRKSSSGVGTEEMLYAGPAEEALIARDISSDGRYVIFDNAKLNDLKLDILAMPLTGDKKPFTYLHSSFNNTQPQLSPDGRWLAYSTNESGSYQIVVRTFPDPNGGRWQVTANGGMEPRWRRDGRELYYVALDGKLMAVPIRPHSTFQADQATTLFQTPLTFPTSIPFPIRYDVTADGKRFLMTVPANTSESSAPAALMNPAPIVAIVNWTAAFRKK